MELHEYRHYEQPLLCHALWRHHALRQRAASLLLPSRGYPLEKTGNGNRHIYDIISATDKALAATYTETPELILRLQDEGEIARIEDPPSQEIKPALNLTEKLKESKAETIKTSKDEDVAVDDWKIFVRKPNFWNFKAWLSLKFTQNYVSDNWYQGGEKNNSLLSELNLEANYNNKQKVTFDNKLEMKLGFQSSENDDEHKFKTNSDLIRLTNKLGLRAIKHWYYLISLQSWTQFYPGYRANDKRVYSDFMSPFESLFSIGMEYRPQFKKFWLEANLNPLALRCKYVDRGYLASSFGIDKNRRVKWSYGSNITINYNWNIVKNISWKGRIYWFTDYSLTQFEWENTFKFTINRYLNTELFLYPRFDDNRRRKEGASYWQFRELLSIGLTLSI